MRISQIQIENHYSYFHKEIHVCLWTDLYDQSSKDFRFDLTASDSVIFVENVFNLFTMVNDSIIQEIFPNENMTMNN